MKRKFKLQNKILIVLLLVCFMPFLSFSAYVYYNYTENLRKSAEQNAYEDIRKSDKLVFYNIWLAENTTKYIIQDGGFCEMMKNGCTPEEFSAYMKEAIAPAKIIKGVVAFTENDEYSYGYTSENDDKVEFALLNGKDLEDTDGIKWGGRKNGYMLAGTKIYDSKEKTGVIGSMYLLVGDDAFADVLSDDSGIIAVCDTSGDVIVSNNEKISGGSNMWRYSIEISDFIHSDDGVNTEIEFDGRKYLTVKYMSQFTGWYFVKLVDKSVFMKDITFMKYALLIIGLGTLAAIFLLHIFIIRKLFKPFAEINRAMRNVVSDDFDIALDIHTNDEFETISDGFNHMVKEISTLVKNIKESNEERMRLETEALQYQIDPHFLYNILAAVRFVALKNGSRETSDMLLKLNRLFRIKLKYAGKDSVLENDMDIMMDYTELWNLRYNNKIQFFFDISESSKQCRIPTLILQPIIENAIIHGASTRVIKDETAVVRIKTEYTDTCLKLSVYDNGMGIDDKTKSELLSNSYSDGIGYSNVQKRLMYRYGDKADMEISSKLGEYTEVSLMIYE